MIEAAHTNLAGLVMRAGAHPTLRFALVTLAFDVRHPTGRRRSVYDIADSRLHPSQERP